MLLALLAACESTSFEKPPVAELACDPALVGRWASIGERADEAGDVELQISAQCELKLSDRHNGAMRVGDATTLHVGVYGDLKYLWADTAWAHRRFESDLVATAGDVTVLRYVARVDSLDLQVVDDKAVAHRIIDDKITGGESHKTHEGLQNRITGAAQPKVLQLPGFFVESPLRFRRIAANAP